MLYETVAKLFWRKSFATVSKYTFGQYQKNLLKIAQKSYSKPQNPS